MSFSLRSNISNSNLTQLEYYIINRKLIFQDFIGNHHTLVLQEYEPNSSINFPIDFPENFYTKNQLKEYVIINDTNYNITLNTHLKIELFPQTMYKIFIKFSKELKKIKVAVLMLYGFNSVNIGITKISIYPYDLRVCDILPNPSDIKNNQLTFVGVGGDVFLPCTKDIDSIYGNNISVNNNYNISFIVNNLATRQVSIYLTKDQENGLNFSEGKFIMEPNQCYNITVMIISRVNLKSIVGIYRVV